MGRLNDGSEATSTGFGGPMKVGEERMISVKDSHTKQFLHFIRLIRTERPYCFDLRDAYNESLRNRDPNLSAQIEYAVGVNDQIYLRERQPISGTREESYYEPTPDDAASIKSFIADCMKRGLSQQEFNKLVRRTGGAPRRV